jgi:beta-lactamase regulating signal transducer with metallopeptidase domain
MNNTISFSEFVLQLVNSLLVERIGWLLIPTCWQFAAVGMLTFAMDKLLSRCAASVRYWALLTAMCLLVVIPVATLTVVPVADAADTRYVVAEEHSGSSNSSETSSIPMADAGVVVSSSADDWKLQSARDVSQVEGKTDQSAALVLWHSRFSKALEPWLTTIVGIWCIGVLILSVRPVWSWLAVRRLRRMGVSSVSDGVQAAFCRMQERLQIKRRVQVLQSTMVSSPIVVGCFRSVILLPPSFILGVPTSQLEAILAHELAHVKRYDYITNLLQTLTETLFFYHPAVWWLSHRVRTERENCCDDLAVAALGNKVEYGRALLAVEELRCPAASTLAVGVGDGSLLARVRRLFAEPAPDDQRSGAGLAGVGLITAGLLSIFISVTVSVDANELELTTDEPTAVFVAQVTEAISVELHGVVNAAPNSVGCWQADGTSMKRKDDWPEVLAVRDQNPTHGFVFRLKGISKTQSLAWRIPGQWAVPDHVKGPNQIVIPSTRITDGETVDLEVGITTADWGPWQRVEKNGSVDQPVQADPVLQNCYDGVGTDVHVGNIGTLLTGLELRGIPSSESRMDYEVVAIGVDGVRHAFNGASASAAGNTIRYFSQKIADIKYFEFRLRPYHQWATFENVSLTNDHKTEVKVSVRTNPVSPPNSYVAELPDGQTVELAGITPNNSPASEGWRPDGRPQREGIAKWRKDTLLGGNARDFLFRFTGLKDVPSLRFSLPGRGAHYSILRHDQLQQPCLLRVGGSLLGDKSKMPGEQFDPAAGIVRVVFTDEPWGKWLQISAETGEVLNPLSDGDRYRHHYDNVVIREDGEILDKKAPPGSVVVLQRPMQHYDLYDFQIRGVDSAGKEFRDLGWIGAGDSGSRSVTDSFRLRSSLPEGRNLSHFEFRLRPFRHIITFENVVSGSASDEPSDVKVKTELIPRSKIDTGFKVQLPDGKSIEFVGIKRNRTSADDAWRPDGRKCAATHSGWTESSIDYGEVGRDFLFKFSGFAATPSFCFDVPTLGHESYIQFPDKIVQLSGSAIDYSRVSNAANLPEPNVAKVLVTDAAWGKWLQIAPDGKYLNPMTDSDLYQSFYDSVQIEAVSGDKRVKNIPSLKVIHPKGYSRIYDFEFKAWKTDGSKCRLAADRALVRTKDMSRNPGHVYYPREAFPDAVTISRFEFRLRPFRHMVRFENVVTDSVTDEPTDVQISVETLPTELAEAKSQTQ